MNVTVEMDQRALYIKQAELLVKMSQPVAAMYLYKGADAIDPTYWATKAIAELKNFNAPDWLANHVVHWCYCEAKCVKC